MSFQRKYIPSTEEYLFNVSVSFQSNGMGGQGYCVVLTGSYKFVEAQYHMNPPFNFSIVAEGSDPAMLTWKFR